MDAEVVRLTLPVVDKESEVEAVTGRDAEVDRD